MSVDIATAILGVPNIDHSILVAPVLRYAREWWLATHPTQKPDHDVLTPFELAQAYECEVARYKEGARITTGSIRTRPLLAALCALLRAQWAPSSANRWRDAQGDDVAFTEFSEKALRTVLLRDLQALAIDAAVVSKAEADGQVPPQRPLMGGACGYSRLSV